MGAPTAGYNPRLAELIQLSRAAPVKLYLATVHGNSRDQLMAGILEAG